MAEGQARAGCGNNRDAGEFVGRTAEHSLIGELAGETAGGRSWAVLIDGELGIGKTALLRSATASLWDFSVLRVWCDPAEAGLPFGLISQLLWRALSHAGGPPPAADLMTPQGSPAQVGAYLLDLVHEAQESRPVAVVIDDLQWADQASAEALGYVLRRLGESRVLTLLAARTGAESAGEWAHGPADGWRRLVDNREFGRRLSLRGMTREEVAELARRLGHQAVPVTVAERLRRHTGGNPAYLRALLAGLPPAQLASADRPLPVRGLVATQVGRLLSELPEPSLRLLDALAVLNARYALGVAARAAGVDDPASALEPLLRCRVVQWWPEEPATPVAIRLPVQRDAIYRMLSPVRRRELHLATASLVQGYDRWQHRVAAANGLDQGLVAELGRAAAALLGQGAAERGATLMLWAADLCTDRSEHERHLLIGVANLIWCHCAARAEALRPRVAACAPGPLRDLILVALTAGRADLESARDLLAGALARDIPDAPGPDVPGPDVPGPDVPGPDLLAADLAAAGLAQAAARAALAVLRRHAWQDGDQLDDAADHGDIAGRVLAAEGLDAETRQTAECLVIEAAGRRLGGLHAVLRSLEQVSPAPVPAGAPASAILLWRRGIWRAAIGHLPAAADDLSAARQLAAGAVAAALDASATALLSYVQYLLGTWQAAAVTAEQAAELALSQGTTCFYAQVYAASACVAASRGDWARATDHVAASRQWRRTAPAPAAAVHPALAGATLAQARGDYAGMLAALGPLLAQPAAAGEREHYQCWWRPLHVEALVGTGQLDDAAQALAELARLAEAADCLQAGYGWLSGWLAYRHGQPELARTRYEDALSRPAPAADLPLLRARLEHAYGQLLLVQRSRRSAITWLRHAHDHYAALGAGPFAERCSAELAAIGQRAAEPGGAARRAVLSSREHRVAHLVTQGLTNSEVARELYVTPKTVEFHLSNIFTKLGITSRRQLRDHFPDGDTP